MKPIGKAARVVATEVMLLLDPAPSGHVSRRILEKLPTFDPDERKAAVLLGLRIAYHAIEQMWPAADDEASRHAGESTR